MSMYQTLWNAIRSTADKDYRDALKFLVGEIQRVEPKEASDEVCFKVIKRVVKDLEYVLTRTFDPEMTKSISKEVVWFKALLPQPLSMEEYDSHLAMFLVTTENPTFEHWHTYLQTRIVGRTLDMGYAVGIFQKKITK